MEQIGDGNAPPYPGNRDFYRFWMLGFMEGQRLHAVSCVLMGKNIVGGFMSLDHSRMWSLWLKVSQT